MESNDSDLGDLFQAWTEWAGWAFSLTILGLSVIGLALSLTSFVRMYRHVQESGGMGGVEVPWGHIMAVMIAGLISVSGLIFGMSSLLWSQQ